MIKKPIVSVAHRASTGQLPNLPGRNMPTYSERLHSEFFWRFENLCLFHQLINNELNKRNKNLDYYTDEAKKFIKENLLDNESYEAQIFVSRYRTNVIDQENIINSICSLGDESTIIGLWAMVEQFSARSYVILEAAVQSKAESEVNPPHRWDKLKNRFDQLGIDLTSLDGYGIINECRVINNKIKHLYYVDDELALFARFASEKGKPIKKLNFPMQDYSDSCHEFIIHLFEKIDLRIDGFLNP